MSETSKNLSPAVTNSAEQSPSAARRHEDLPLRMLHDRVLVLPEKDASERQSSAGLVIPASAVGPKRLSWAVVSALGDTVRQVRRGDRVLYDPEDKSEVDIAGRDYVLLREKDIHAVAHQQDTVSQPGLYL